MNAEPSMLQQLQTVAVAALQADPRFDGTSSANGQPIPVITEYKNDIITQIETALGSVGICAVLVTPLFELFDELLYPGELSGWAYPSVNILENVPANQSPSGTQIHAITLASYTVAILHCLSTGLPVADIAESPPHFIALKRPLVLVGEGPPLSYQVNFQAHVTLP
jgi:hypothetical protein